MHNKVAARTARNITTLQSVPTRTYGISIPGGGRKSDKSTYGFPDIFQPTSGKVWEVKHASNFGVESGKKQLARYLAAGKTMSPQVILGEPVPSDSIPEGNYSINIRAGGPGGDVGALVLYSLQNNDGEKVNIFEYAIKTIQEKEGSVNSEVSRDLTWALIDLPKFIKDNPEYASYQEEFEAMVPQLQENLKKTENPVLELLNRAKRNIDSAIERFNVDAQKPATIPPPPIIPVPVPIPAL